MNLIGRELKVKHTNSYSKFSVLPMNRGIDSKHVQKMITSIRKMGVLRCVIACTTNIIEGEWKTYIIDGQHLATALEREGQPIPYVEITVDSEEDLIEKMAYLNNSSKSWDLMNYINAWKMIRPDYMKLFKWKNMYDIEITMLAAIGVNSSSFKFSTGTIKTGEFSDWSFVGTDDWQDYAELSVSALHLLAITRIDENLEKIVALLEREN